MTDVNIRKAKQSDTEKLTRLRLQLQRHCEKSNSHIWKITKVGEALLEQKVLDDLGDANSRLLVAELNGEVVGFAYGEISRRAEYLPAIVGSISTVYVERSARRRGVGTLLVSKMCEFFKSRNVKDVSLRYIVGNKHAEMFWSRLGFSSIIITANTDLKELQQRVNKYMKS